MRELVFACALVSLWGCGDRDPYFDSLLPPVDTLDALGPYVVEAWVVAPRGVAEVVLGVASDPETEQVTRLGMDLVQGTLADGRWRVSLRGRPPGTRLYLYATVLDQGNARAVHPPGAPQQRLSFGVLAD